MSSQDTKTGLAGALEARKALKQRCLALVRRWQPLAQSGWVRSAARQLGEDIDLIANTSERLGLDSLNTSALELAAYLCSFVDDQLIPNECDLARLADMVNALDVVLTNLSDTETADIHSLPRARAETKSQAPTPTAQVERPIQGTSSSAQPPVVGATATDQNFASVSTEGGDAGVSNAVGAPVRLPRAVCLVGLDSHLVPGLAVALSERGYDVREFSHGEALLDFLKHATPGALILEARKLHVMTRILMTHGNQGETGPALIVISPDGDLGHRLLAMRAGASALFGAPVDSLRVIAKLDELLTHNNQTAYRVLLVDPDRNHAAEAARWLAQRGMTSRLVSNGQAALTAIGEFRPDIIVIDCDLPDVNGIELTQLIRQQNEYVAVPIILAASESQVNQRFDAITAGGDEFLSKPVKARHLLSVVLSRANRAHWLREVIGQPSNRDPRTNLYSRHALIEKLEAAFGDRSAGLLFIALDHSDQLREQIGISGLGPIDAHIGGLLRSQLDELDIPAQYQDFHYFVLFHRRSRAEITAVAERIRNTLADQAWQFNGKSYALTASIGMALLGGEQTSVDAVVANAEAAQLAAAHLGGNRVLWFETKEAALMPVDPMLAVRAVLSRPLTPEQTTFEFAPIVPLAGKLTGQYELSFKVKSVQHPSTAVAYGELAPIAAECQQLIQLDRWLLEHSLKVREEQLKRGRQLRLFVPQSVDSMLEPELLWWLTRTLKERHLSGTGLTLELACSALIDAGAQGAERVKALHAQGVRVCLADFGRDWAAVHALKNIDVDYVRLAPALIEELNTAKSISDTLLALVRKAHAAGAAVIAPQVDSIQRAHVLLRLGVDYASGPGLARAQLQPDFDFNRPLW